MTAARVRPLVAANWKMNTTVDQGCLLARDVCEHADKYPDIDVVLFPPFVHLWPVADILGATDVDLGAQNMHWETSGAFTGEISASMISPVCRYVLLGHSERRHIFHETEDVIARKVRTAVAEGLRIMLAIGETESQRKEGRTMAVLEQQLTSALPNTLSSISQNEIVIAYEPVWAIGTGITPTPEEAEVVSAEISRWCADRFTCSPDTVKVVYGGSVTAENAVSFVRQPSISGALVGGASLHIDAFDAIMQAAQESRTLREVP
ncbi:MAG: triose-phosphate isomerase [Candidatus Dormibacteria bacterium]